MHIFLDIDGVLRRLSADPSCLEPRCVEQFGLAVRPIEELKIVISSTWRLAMSLGELRGHFPDEIAARIVGVTPELTDDGPHVRYREIMAYLSARGIDESWLAIDDDPELFPQQAPALITDPYQGFDSRCVVRLWEQLAV